MQVYFKEDLMYSKINQAVWKIVVNWCLTMEDLGYVSVWKMIGPIYLKRLIASKSYPKPDIVLA